MVIVHVDGIGADSLKQALREGDMPYIQILIDTEGYVLHRYRCGNPWTTQFVTAGHLSVDN